MLRELSMTRRLNARNMKGSHGLAGEALHVDPFARSLGRSAVFVLRLLPAIAGLSAATFLLAAIARMLVPLAIMVTMCRLSRNMGCMRGPALADTRYHQA
jgi:hypothetical protein